MNARRKTLARLSEDAREGFARVAAKGDFGKPPFPPHGNEDVGNPFKKGGDIGAPTKRNIPTNHEFDKKAVKPLVKTLWAMSVALGHALTAHRQFSRLKSSTFSPDGLLGGRGYVVPVKDLRHKLFEACEVLSGLCDSLHDEINAPHWKPKIAELEAADMDEVEKLLGDAEEWIDNPEEEADEELEDVEKKSWTKSKKERFEKEHQFGSKLPDGGDQETLHAQGPHPAGNEHPFDRKTKQASAIRYSYDRAANSSIPVESEPGGPRIQHLDRADTDQTGPAGSYNQGEPPVTDAWGESGGVSGEPMSQNDGNSYVYDRTSASGIPDSNTDSTPGQGYDFGIGDGNGNDAHGQGAGGYGEGNPGAPGEGSRGVYGPRAELPSDPGGKTKDTEESDTTPTVERSTAESGHMGLPVNSTTKLPNDGADSVSRSDYYDGDKGNDFNGKIHAQSMTPGENASAGSEMPGDEEANVYDYGKDFSPNMGDRVEHGDQPYIKWDDTTHNMRPDYNYQRDPIQGPYPKQDL